MPISSKANTINLTMGVKNLSLYDFGLAAAVDRLTRGVQEQLDGRAFDEKLAERTFVDVDYILRLIHSHNT